MCQFDRIKQMQNEIQSVARKYNARRIFVFGSCASQLH